MTRWCNSNPSSQRRRFEVTFGKTERIFVHLCTTGNPEEKDTGSLFACKLPLDPFLSLSGSACLQMSSKF